MLILGKYHSRDIHEWEGGSCSFHSLVKGFCKECVEDKSGFYPDMKCKGQPHRSVHSLKCEFHGLAYEIKCAKRAKNANSVIDPELGRGHSNLPEATFSLLTKFRAKDTNTNTTKPPQVCVLFKRTCHGCTKRRELSTTRLWIYSRFSLT